MSLGLVGAGAKSRFAVELSPMASETYWWNFIRPKSDLDFDEYRELDLEAQAGSGLVIGDIAAVNESLPTLVGPDEVDVVAGGPPCQGFSLAGKRQKGDARNRLPWEFLEFVNAVRPKMVIMENVAGMGSKFDGENDSVFGQLGIALAETGGGYRVQKVLANAKHYGAPQNRPRLLLIGLRADIAEKQSIEVSESLWKSDYVEDLVHPIPPLAPKPTASKSNAPVVLDAIGDLSSTKRKKANYVTNLNSAFSHVLNGDDRIENHNRRSHSEEVQLRFRVYQFMKEKSIKRGILNPDPSETDDQMRLRISEQLSGISMPAKLSDGTALASTHSDLVDLFLRLKTKKHSQRVIGWDETAGTVLTIGDDYVHPDEPRVFTVRELARFQGFPDAFTFRGKETTGGLKRRVEVPQYTQVGNAVSPLVGLALGKMINSILGKPM